MPKFIHSLKALAIYKSRIHFNSENDKQIYSLRNSSRGCLWTILDYGDALDQQELVNIGIAGVLFVAISSAGGISEERDSEIREELFNIADFLKFLNNGRDITKYPSFPPQPLLAKISIEQIEEEGANEEVDAQIANKGLYGNVKDKSKEVEGLLLNFFIDKNSSKPYWY
ncbi:MAG: hypothetical protein EZS28_005785 [Streblomastix strix]|uniref:Uncharacterized protein n=1 Tax=Streblomastix strix TaxID=222440 RepID=A0A5J4WV63_9EUKA|nr:MAG: hypothetical protein EZS28_005785 [Streblomastix strix]